MFSIIITQVEYVHIYLCVFTSIEKRLEGNTSKCK